MTRLSDTQLVVLSAAAGRRSGDVLPMPGTLRGAAVAKVAEALSARGLIVEEMIGHVAFDDRSRQRIWRWDADGRAFRLRITDAGLEAIGVEPVRAGKAEAVKVLGALLEQSEADAEETRGSTSGRRSVAAAAPRVVTRPDMTSHPVASPTVRMPRPGTRQAALVEMLSRPEGASIPEIVAELGWKPYTIRGAISGVLKKRLGLPVTSGKIEGRGTVHRVVSTPLEG